MSTVPAPPVVLAITGASGAPYAVRLLQVLVDAGHEVHLTISSSAALVLEQELAVTIDLREFRLEDLLLSSRDTSAEHPALRRILARMRTERPGCVPIASEPGKVVYHHVDNYMAAIASGSFLTRGMVICPCSGSTLSGVVYGASNNLIHRAADVHLKERRKLILVTRETPLSVLHLENLKRAAEFGAVVMPASPGWYHGVESLEDLLDFVIARILDQLGIAHELMRRWGC